MKRFFALLLLSFALSAHAGYYARTLTSSSTSAWALKTSSCFMTVGMAIASTYGYPSQVVVTGLNPATATFGATLSNNSVNVTGDYGECTATAAGGVQPVILGAVGDPGIVVGGVSSGSGASGSGSATLSDIEFNANAFDEAFQGGLMLFVTGFGIGLIVQVIRRLRSP